MILAGRIAAITASGSGMGRATARRMAAEGATVVVADINREAAEETVALIRDDGGTAVAHTVDVTDLGSLRALFDRIERDYGVLHVLHAHAGVPGAGGLDVSEADFDRAVALNMKSAFFSAAYAAPLLRKAEGKGSLIFTASAMGLVGSPSSPLYSLTKGGIVTMTKSLALQLGPEIRVNVICPGVVDTPMLGQFFGREAGADVDDLIADWVRTAIPLQRKCQPEEIAEAALYLASDASTFTTGIALPVDGGFTAH